MPGITLRPPTEEDLPRLVQISRAAGTERGIESTINEDDIQREWAMPGISRENNFVVAVLDGTIAGRAGISPLPDSDQAHGGGYVAAEYRGRGVGTKLLEWQISKARSFPGVAELRTGAGAERTEAIALFDGWGGFEHIRSWFRMRNPAPASIADPDFPAGIELRHFTGDEWIDNFVAAYDGSFIDHFNFHPADREEVAYWEKTEPDFDPTLCTFAFEGETLAGFCNTWLIKGGSKLRGDLGPIGTMRSHRGIGLGRALLRHGTRELAARGAVEVTLGVDSENPNGAVRLYASNGYEQTHEGRSYRLKL